MQGRLKYTVTWFQLSLVYCFWTSFDLYHDTRWERRWSVKSKIKPMKYICETEMDHGKYSLLCKIYCKCTVYWNKCNISDWIVQKKLKHPQKQQSHRHYYDNTPVSRCLEMTSLTKDAFTAGNSPSIVSCQQFFVFLLIFVNNLHWLEANLYKCVWYQ